MSGVLSIKTNAWKIPLFIVMLLFIAGCGQNTNQKQNFVFEEEMSMSEERSAIETQIPPIDLRIPEKLQTATFALG